MTKIKLTKAQARDVEWAIEGIDMCDQVELFERELGDDEMPTLDGLTLTLGADDVVEDLIYRLEDQLPMMAELEYHAAQRSCVAAQRAADKIRDALAARADERAKAARKEQDESRERCDTDGVISQWANGIENSRHQLVAEIARDGGAEFTGLYEGARRVLAKMIDTQYGDAWLLHRSEGDLIARRGSRYLPTGARSRVHRKLGLRECKEKARARAEIVGVGRGISGHAWAAAVRVNEWGDDAKPLA